MYLLLGALVFSLIAAHFVGSHLAGRIEVEPGHIREVMPTIPVAPLQTGSEGRRWRKNVRRVEARLLDHFSGDATEVSAEQLAAELSEDKRVVAGALERMREEVDCRLQITRDGTILHDFSAEQLEKLRSRQNRAIPTKLFMFAVAAASNIGAIWPVLSILFLAIVSLDAVLKHADGVVWGAFGIGLIVAVFGATLIVSLGIHFLLTPLASGPTLGPMKTDEPMPDRRSSTSTSGSSNVWFFFGDGHHGGGSSGGGGDFDGEGAGQAIVIIILIAIIVLCVLTVAIWLRGLWRAVFSRDENLDRISPSEWVRTADVVDAWEKWVPTNDLVGRAVRTLRRTFAHRRPVDGDLGPRTLARAKRRGGIVSALEVALEEGLDLDEATEVGAELCDIVGGEIVVNDAGELGFAFPDEVLREIDEYAGFELSVDDWDDWRGSLGDENYDHLWAEYLQLEAPEGDEYAWNSVGRRPSQPLGSLPVNLVGLGWGHLQATDRLVGGTWIMALTGIYLLLWGAPSPVEPYLVGSETALVQLLSNFNYTFSGLLFFAAFGATCLSAAARYVANRRAVQGIRRDIRRAIFHRIDVALEAEQTGLVLSDAPRRLCDVFDEAWPGISEQLVEAELRGVLVDLELEPDLDAPPDEAGERLDLEPLLNRWKSAREEGFETVFEEPVELEETEAAEPSKSTDRDREIVFDTKREHDHVTALA